MSFRLLSRAGIGQGARLVGKNKNVAKLMRVAGAERYVSSSVGHGQDHFRRPYTSRPGMSGRFPPPRTAVVVRNLHKWLAGPSLL